MPETEAWAVGPCSVEHDVSWRPSGFDSWTEGRNTMMPGLSALGLLVGSAAGGTAALLVAPETGSDLRRRARARAQPAAARVRATALALSARIRAPPTE
jgi:hypothetical protein